MICAAHNYAERLKFWIVPKAAWQLPTRTPPLPVCLEIERIRSIRIGSAAWAQIPNPANWAIIITTIFITVRSSTSVHSARFDPRTPHLNYY
jgi:hypothetical protein